MTDILARFDFILLDTPTRQLVQQRTDEIRRIEPVEIKGLVKRIAQSTVQIGQRLEYV
jgi:hypothetical protein